MFNQLYTCCHALRMDVHDVGGSSPTLASDCPVTMADECPVPIGVPVQFRPTLASDCPVTMAEQGESKAEQGKSKAESKAEQGKSSDYGGAGQEQGSDYGGAGQEQGGAGREGQEGQPPPRKARMDMEQVYPRGSVLVELRLQVPDLFDDDDDDDDDWPCDE